VQFIFVNSPIPLLLNSIPALLTAYCLLPTTYYLLPTTYFLPNKHLLQVNTTVGDQAHQVYPVGQVQQLAATIAC